MADSIGFTPSDGGGDSLTGAQLVGDITAIPGAVGSFLGNPLGIDYNSGITLTIPEAKPATAQETVSAQAALGAFETGNLGVFNGGKGLTIAQSNSLSEYDKELGVKPGTTLTAQQAGNVEAFLYNNGFVVAAPAVTATLVPTTPAPILNPTGGVSGANRGTSAPSKTAANGTVPASTTKGSGTAATPGPVQTTPVPPAVLPPAQTTTPTVPAPSPTTSDPGITPDQQKAIDDLKNSTPPVAPTLEQRLINGLEAAGAWILKNILAPIGALLFKGIGSILAATVGKLLSSLFGGTSNTNYLEWIVLAGGIYLVVK